MAGKAPAADKLIPLSDGAGDIVAVGDGVTEYKKSDRVISRFFPEWVDGEPPNRFGREIFASVPGDGADGYAREYVTAPASAFTPAPKGFSYAESASLVCAGLTAWRALTVEAHVKAGDIVLVQGTGGVSVFALQFAKAMGARVIALDVNPQRLARAKEFGADELVNPGSNDPVAAIKELTRGKFADYTLDTSSNREARLNAIRSTKVWGTMCFVGEGGDVTIDVSPHLLRRQMTLIASWTFSTIIQAECAQFCVDRTIDVDKLFTHKWTLDGAEEAYKLFDKQSDGKGVFLI